MLPDHQTIMLPLLRYAEDGQLHSLQEAIAALAQHFQLTEKERQQRLPSGRQAMFDNRVGWARTYLKKACLLESPKRGMFRLTPRGRNVLAQNPARVDTKFLEQFPEFVEFKRTKPLSEVSDETDNALRSDRLTRLDALPSDTPEEWLESAYQKLRGELAIELLAGIMSCSPQFFEVLVVDLLVSMGYGGSRREAGQAVGQSGDGGIDGMIKEDRLGLDIIYIQAKRWDNTVGRPEIQKFAGALQGFRAKKGIFITTSSFSREARDYVSRIDSTIILIDGGQLAEYMIDHNVGVSTVATYEVKRIDSDYFEEDGILGRA